MQTKHDNDAVRSMIAFLVVMLLGLAGMTGAKYWGYLHSHTSFAWLVGMGQGTPPPPPLPKNGNVKIEGPSDFKAEMSDAMGVLKTQAPDSYAKYVKPTLRVIQFTSANQTPVDNLGVINMGVWDTGSFTGGNGKEVLNKQNPCDIGCWSYNGPLIPKEVYNDPRWVAGVIVAYTVLSSGFEDSSVSEVNAVCAQYHALKEINAFLQYADPASCVAVSGGGQ